MNGHAYTVPGHSPSTKSVSIASRRGKLLWNPLLQLVAAAFVERLRTDQALEVTILVECQRAIFGTAGVRVHVSEHSREHRHRDIRNRAVGFRTFGGSSSKPATEKITTGGSPLSATSRTD